jgi:hypothetical protein
MEPKYTRNKLHVTTLKTAVLMFTVARTLNSLGSTDYVGSSSDYTCNWAIICFQHITTIFHHTVITILLPFQLLLVRILLTASHTGSLNQMSHIIIMQMSVSNNFFILCCCNFPLYSSYSLLLAILWNTLPDVKPCAASQFPLPSDIASFSRMC